MLIPTTINANPTITPGETKPRLVSEDRFLRVLSGPAAVGLCPQAMMLLRDLPYNRPTSPQSSLSQPIADSLSTGGGIVRSWCNLSSCCCHPVPVPQVLFGCTDPVQVLLHVVCHCEDDQLSILPPCSAVLGVSQYGHCNLLPWPHLQSSCLLAACLTLGIFLLVFFKVSRKASLVS